MDGAHVRVVGAAEMPHNKIIIFALVGAQNELNIFSWKVLRQQTVVPCQEISLSASKSITAPTKSR